MMHTCSNNPIKQNGVIMKKLKLNLDDLKVESFKTETQQLKNKGTVNGNCVSLPSCDPTSVEDRTCVTCFSCFQSCANPTCLTCAC